MPVAGATHFVEEGAGLPVAGLHGGRLDRRHMVACLEPAFEGAQGYRRILHPDIPGHGASPPGGTTGYQDVRERLVGFVRAGAQHFAKRLRDLLRIVVAELSDAIPDDPPATITAPMATLPGRQYKVVGYRPMPERIEQYPHAAFSLFDADGHGLASERPALIAARLRDLLKRLERAERIDA